MNEKERVKEYLDEMLKHYENGFEGIDYDTCKDILIGFYANEKKLSLSVYVNSYSSRQNIDKDKVQKIILKLHRLGMHPSRREKYNCIIDYING